METVIYNSCVFVLCHVINYLPNLLAGAVQKHIGPWSFCTDLAYTSTTRAIIPQNGSGAGLTLKRLEFYLNNSVQFGLVAHLLRSLRQAVVLSINCLDVRTSVKQTHKDMHFFHSILQHPGSCCKIHL